MSGRFGLIYSDTLTPGEEPANSAMFWMPCPQIEEYEEGVATLPYHDYNETTLGWPYIRFTWPQGIDMYYYAQLRRLYEIARFKRPEDTGPYAGQLFAGRCWFTYQNYLGDLVAKTQGVLDEPEAEIRENVVQNMSLVIGKIGFGNSPLIGSLETTFRDALEAGETFEFGENAFEDTGNKFAGLDQLGYYFG